MLHTATDGMPSAAGRRLQPRSDMTLVPRVLTLCVLLALLLFGSAHADRRPEGPGWYSIQLGRFTVTALYDGTIGCRSTRSSARRPRLD